MHLSNKTDYSPATSFVWTYRTYKHNTCTYVSKQQQLKHNAIVSGWHSCQNVQFPSFDHVVSVLSVNSLLTEWIFIKSTVCESYEVIECFYQCKQKAHGLPHSAGDSLTFSLDANVTPSPSTGSGFHMQSEDFHSHTLLFFNIVSIEEKHLLCFKAICVSLVL